MVVGFTFANKKQEKERSKKQETIFLASEELLFFAHIVGMIYHFLSGIHTRTHAHRTVERGEQASYALAFPAQHN